MPALHRLLYNRKTLIFVVLLFMATLVFSCFVVTFNVISPFASGTSDKNVSTETELREAINNVSTKKAYTIALNNDITLTDSTLNIPANKHIRLTSNKAEGHYKLIGTAHWQSPVMVVESSVSTITVNGDGILELDDICITHTHNASLGYVVSVNENGQLIMHKGLISSNIGGIYNGGIFLMHNGEISGNTAINGGGVFNRGVFRMFGGEIAGNSAGNNGGGVYNEAGGTFEMSGGKIFGNTAATGGGIINYGGVIFIDYTFTGTYTKEISGYDQHEGSFTLSGGVIAGNTAWRGGGVGNCGVFIMNGGVISDNTGIGSGGGVDNGCASSSFVGNFEMSGGEIYGNTAEKGGGVYNFFNSLFSLTGSGVISGNTAKWGGGGVCIDNDFDMSGGVISDNTAQMGGGVYVGNGVFKLSGGKISGNVASSSNDVYVGNGVFEQTGGKISGNVAGYLGVIVVTVCIVIVCLFLYFKKRKKKVLSEITSNIKCS
ncbi:MAG: hypothetical protein FWD52_03390 [Candidatus Bathyarchaeota archaeon]|nr:hypothetical protein [Candidatus Termiticorpusculum sp.]